jgi:hypothetical protein
MVLLQKRLGCHKYFNPDFLSLHNSGEQKNWRKENSWKS